MQRTVPSFASLRSLPFLAVLAAVLTVAAVLAPACLSQEDTDAATSDETATTSAASGDVERGRYLVESVAMCGQCHTPRDAAGNLDMNRWLHGAAVPVTTPPGYPVWAHKAPRIAGLPQYKNEDGNDEFVTLLTTGINRDGKEAMPPMPPFRMSEDDARAIEAYLRSLN